MKKAIFILAVLSAALSQAAWYWPFPSAEDNTNRPPRLHRLLEKANDFIELAEDESLKGEADKALDFYRQALDELMRVQRENPDRAEKPEFAPLRNKIAACKAAVDTIRFEQINANVRAVSVTDTTALQRRWNRRHGISDPEDEQQSDGQPGQGKDGQKPSDEWNSRLAPAMEKLRAGNYSEASVILEELAPERPDDLNLLMLRSAALAGTGRYYAARKLLEQAVKAHPESYMPHYNLAYVALELGDGRAAAQRHYKNGREVGGPVNIDLEERLKDD